MHYCDLVVASDVTIIDAALPSSYSFHHVPRSMNARERERERERGGGGGEEVDLL